MVAYSGGRATRQPGGLRISFSNETDRFIAYAPDNQVDWEARLKWVEKQSAAYLLDAPILYGIQWKAKGGRSSRARALRLSVGLSLSLGQPHPRRYTCILEVGKRHIRIAEGGQLPELTNGTKLLLTSPPTWAENELERLAPAVLKSCEQFQQRPQVQIALSTLSEEFSTELSDLDRLYRRKQGTNDRLYGLPPADSDGSVAIESELQRLQTNVLERYRVGVRVRILSLGVFEGAVPEAFLSL